MFTRLHRGFTEDFPKEPEECLACWTHLWDTASLQSTAPSPELQQEPQSWHGFARGVQQLAGGLNKQSTTGFVPTARRDFATCVCWEHPAHTGRAASPGGTSQPDEPIRLAMPPRPASCHQLCPKNRTLASKSNLHKHIHALIHTEEPPESLLPSHPLPKHKMLLPHSVTSPFWAAESPKMPSLYGESAPVTEIFSRTQHDN